MNPTDCTPPVFWFYLATFLAGGVIGLSEIISRYKDAPLNAATTAPGIVYCLLNAGGAAGALALMLQMGWFKDLAPGPVGNLIMQSILAATGTMAIFRSSLFTVRVGNADVSIGPAAFLQILMTATDRAVDRARAQPRAAAVQRIMTDIDFQKAKQALPTLCFGLMQNVSIQEQDTFGTIVAKLDSADMDDVFKTNNLGLALMNLVGEEVLARAVDMLRADIAEVPQPIVQSLETLGLLRAVTFAGSGKPLIEGCVFLSNKSSDTKINGDLDAERLRISAMTVSDRQKILLLSAALIGRFGEPLMQLALRALPENDPPRSSIPSPGLAQAIRALRAEMTADHVIDACLILTNRVQDPALRAQLAAEAERIAALPIPGPQRLQFLASILIGRFGEDTVRGAIEGLGGAAVEPDATPS